MQHSSAPRTQQEFLLRTMPQIKLGIGAVLDKLHQDVVPKRYRDRLTEDVLEVSLHPAIAELIADFADEVESELSEASAKHALLYDRRCSVTLEQATTQTAPAFEVRARPAGGATQSRSHTIGETGDSGAKPTHASVSGPHPSRAPETEKDIAPETMVEEGMGWDPEHWRLCVKSRDGDLLQIAPLPRATTLVGRDPHMDPTAGIIVLLPSLTTVSRQMLLVRWEPEAGQPGFRIVNLGSLPIHLPKTSIPGARLRDGSIDAAMRLTGHATRVRPGEPFAVGTAGPVIIIDSAT